MAVQQEIKSQLAKLLATEDLVVEHRKVETAQFDVGTRVLTLPVWNASDTVYDMLVGHEVAHALFTPDKEWWKDHKIPQQFVNVCEDVRVEKLMKRKYLGIAKSFYRGYNELHTQDFFEIDGEDISDFNLADRANLHYKIGSFVDVSFSVPEKEIVDLIGSAETFSQMLNAAEKLYDYCKKQQEENEKVNPEKQSELDNAKLEMEAPNLGEDTTEYEDQEESGDNDKLESFPQTPQMEESGSEKGNDTLEEPEVKTVDSLESKLQDLVNTEGADNVYVEIPKVNLDSVIASNEEVHEEIDDYWDVVEKQWSESEYMYHAYALKDSIFENADSEYLKFKRSAQKEVSYLVKEFECRKAADNYSRSAINRTGVLDTAKLHTYRFNEDIFKRITTVPDGKNHGLVFILDWSGSMAREMSDTIKQLYNLIWFCRKVNIPFEVYAFSNEWYTRNSGYTRDEGLFENDPNKLRSHYERKEYQLHVDDTFALMNILTSKTNAKTLEHQLLNIWRLALAFSGDNFNAPYRYPNRLCLSGTPLNETLISLHQILPQFQKENKVQKVQCIILTDGEASQIPYNKKVQRHWEDEDFLGCRGCQGDRTFLRDRKVGKTYKFGWNYHEFTQTLITNLKDRFPTTNFIGIRVIANREAMRFAKMYFTNPEEHVKLENQWKKQKSFTIKTSGYDAYFALSSSNLADDAEFDVQEDATKAQIKRAFVKSLKTKKMNKKVLGEFVELVA